MRSRRAQGRSHKIAAEGFAARDAEAAFSSIKKARDMRGLFRQAIDQ